ncbi:MAG: response regulator [Terriglobia bacterium]
MSYRILVIDSDEEQLSQLKSVLEGLGYVVDSALDGLEGFQKGEIFKPDLVITEILTNRLSGFEVSSRIAFGGGFQAPVIFYTSFHRDPEARHEVVTKYHASGYYVKPSELQKLTGAVRSLLTEGTTGGSFIQESETPFAPPKIKARKPRLPSSKEVGPNSNLPNDVSIDSRAHKERFATRPNGAAAAVPAKESETGQRASGFFINTALSDSHPHNRVSAKQTSSAGPSLSSTDTLSASPARGFATKRHFNPWGLILAAGALVLSASLFVFLHRPTLKSSTSSQQPEGLGLKSTVPTALPYFPSAPLPALGATAAAPVTPEKSEVQESFESVQEVLAPLTTPKAERTRSSPSLQFSDVTGSGRPPFVRKTVLPKITRDLIESPFEKAFVIRVEVSRKGKVLDASILNDDDSNPALKEVVLNSILNWEFKPAKHAEGDPLTKYYSFKLVPAHR